MLDIAFHIDRAAGIVDRLTKLYRKDEVMVYFQGKEGRRKPWQKDEPGERSARNRRRSVYMDGVLRKKDSARWFIDNRFDFDVFPLITNQMESGTSKQYVSVSVAESEARSEISLQPKNAKAYPMQISLHADGSLVLCARSNDLIKILRKHHMMWDLDLLGWRRMLPENERVDQAAEIDADLVENGFIAEVCDPDVRRKAEIIISERQNS